MWKASRLTGKLTIATDGGLKATRETTFGWTITTADNTTTYEGAGPVDGPRDVANSTRCEIVVFAAPMLLFTLLAQHWGTKKSAVSFDGYVIVKRHCPTWTNILVNYKTINDGNQRMWIFCRRSEL